MTIIQLETFIKVSEAMSFTAAANTLGYAQSTVTTQIKQLEEELGCLLFERLGKSVVLTPEGEKLLAYAQRMQQLEREILMEVPTEKEPAGVLKLGVSESLCYTVLPDILSEYRKRCPKVDLRLEFVDHDTFPGMLRNGKLDIVYTLNPFITLPDLSILGKKPETMGFYVKPEHPLAKKRKVTEKDLEGVPLLLTSHICNFRQMLLEALAKHRVVPNIAIETGSKEILKQFAANGLGVAFIPDMVAIREAKEGSLCRIDWAGSEFPIFSQVFIHKNKHRGAALEELVNILI